jgi:two-component system, sensor histidine kinase RegB
MFVLQLIWVGVALFGYRLHLPYTSILCVLGVGPLSHVFLFHTNVTAFLYKKTDQIGLALLIDTLTITLILSLTGGPMNPFSIGYLVLVVVASATLNQAWTWAITIVSAACFGISFWFNIPILDLSHHSDEGLSAHLQGMIFSYLLAAAAVSYFLEKIINENNQLKENLFNVRSDYEKMLAITSITADAAHRLRTPLSTMKLIVDELKNTPLITIEEANADIAVLSSEIDRCSHTLTAMCIENGNIPGESEARCDVDTIWRLACSDWPQNVTFKIENLKEQPPMLLQQKPLVRALRSLIENSITASSKKSSRVYIQLSTEQNNDSVKFKVKDNGTGMSSSILEACCQPFYTSSPSNTSLGLGLFVAGLVAKELGGSLKIDSSEGKGTDCTLEVPIRT